MCFRTLMYSMSSISEAADGLVCRTLHSHFMTMCHKATKHGRLSSATSSAAILTVVSRDQAKLFCFRTFQTHRAEYIVSVCYILHFSIWITAAFMTAQLGPKGIHRSIIVPAYQKKSESIMCPECITSKDEVCQPLWL